MSGDVNSSISQRKLNRFIRETAKSVLESIPQIPIHISELKRLMIKENQDPTNPLTCLDDNKRLLSVLTIGATGRNPTFFKALGHEDVFGLKASIPEGSSTVEIIERIPFEEGKDAVSENVLYVQLPEGHPILTSDNETIDGSTEATDLLFDDESDMHLCIDQEGTEEMTNTSESAIGLGISENLSGTNSSLSRSRSSNSSDSGESSNGDPFDKLRFNTEDDDPMSDPICLGTVLDMAPEKEVPLRPAVPKRTSLRTSSRRFTEVVTQNSEVDSNPLCDSNDRSGNDEADILETSENSEIGRKTRSSTDSAECVSSNVQEPIVIDICDGNPPTETSPKDPSSSQLSPHRHNLRPKRITRPPANFKSAQSTPFALAGAGSSKVDEKRRTRNASITLPEKTKPQSSVPSATQKVSTSSPLRSSSSSTAKKAQSSATTDVDIHYSPSTEDISSTMSTMREVLLSLPAFSHSKIRNIHNRSKYKKLSAAAAIQMAHEGSIDIDTPDSILGQVNLRSLVNKSTFMKLPPSYQFKLLHLLPHVDNIFEEKNKTVKLRHTSLTNEFVAKACQEWRERLLRGDFTPETIQKAKIDMEKDKQRIDSWKVKNFEPVWGLRNCRLTFTDTRPESATPSFDNLKPSELVVTESLHDDKPLGKKKKSTIDECDAPRKKFKRDEEILDTPITDIPDDAKLEAADKSQTSSISVIEVPEESIVKPEEENIEPVQILSTPVTKVISPGVNVTSPSETPLIHVSVIPTKVVVLKQPLVAIAPAKVQVPSSVQDLVPPISPKLIATPGSTTPTPPLAAVALPTVPIPLELMDTSPSPAPTSFSSVRTPASSCSRTPSPTLSNPLSVISSGSFHSIPDHTSQISLKSSVVQDQLIAEPDRAETESPRSTCSTGSNTSQTRKYPMTALINRNREPVGIVNLERSMEICKSAAEKAGSTSVVVNSGNLQTLRIQEQVVKSGQQIGLSSNLQVGLKPTGTDPRHTQTQFVLADGTVAKTAVLLKTADGKTLIATNAGQLKQHMRPAVFQSQPQQSTLTQASSQQQQQTQQFQVQLQQVQLRPQQQQVQAHQGQGMTLKMCVPSTQQNAGKITSVNPSLPQRVLVNQVLNMPQDGIFRVPVSTATTGGNTIVLEGSKTFLLPQDPKKPGGSEQNQQIIIRKNGTQTLIPISAFPSNIRFIRSPVVSTQSMTIRMPVTSTVSRPTNTTTHPSPSTTPTGIVVQQSGMPSQHHHQIFQRPLPPQDSRQSVIRAILIPKPGGSGQQQVLLSSFKPGDHQLQPQLVGGQLPSIQLPSEPLPMTSHEVQQHLKSSPAPSPTPKLDSSVFQPMDHSQQQQVLRSLTPVGNDENSENTHHSSLHDRTQNKVLIQVGGDGGSVSKTMGKLVLIRTKNGQLMAIPASQVHPVQTPSPQNFDSSIPPRASSAPPPPQGRLMHAPGQVLLPDGRAGNVDIRVLTVPRPPQSTSSVSMPPSLRATPSPQMKPVASTSQTPEGTNNDIANVIQVCSPAVSVQSSVQEGNNPVLQIVSGEPLRMNHLQNVSVARKGVKTHIPLLPKTPSSVSLDSVHANGGMTCNVKAMVICKQCGAFCHTDCARPQSVCVSCLIR